VETPAQTDTGDKQPSLADAARANAQKDKPKSKRVITDDDLSSIHGKISVVGDHSSNRGSGEDADSDDDTQESRPVSSGKANEQYWRGRANAIKGQIADVDQQISNKKDEIAKTGPAGFDASSGLSQNTIVVHDRNAELKQLEDRKQSLERQLDDLADEGRKAGADSGWFR
jgi:chromosome segregation ATPase